MDGYIPSTLVIKPNTPLLDLAGGGKVDPNVAAHLNALDGGHLEMVGSLTSITLIKLIPTSYFSKHASRPPNQSTIGCIYDQLAFAIMIYMSARHIIH
jgi:hypothetical protein